MVQFPTLFILITEVVSFPCCVFELNDNLKYREKNTDILEPKLINQQIQNKPLL